MVLPEVDMWSEAPVRFAIEIYGYNEENPRATTGMLSVEEWRDTVLLYEGEEILIEAASAYSKANGLYNTLFSMSGVTDIPGAFFVLAVEGEHGRIDMWNNAPANTFDDFGRDDLLTGDREMSLLEVGGTGRRITSVGAYVTNTSVAVQNGGTYSVDYTLHAVAPFSSRGFTRDGRMKPEVLAPGCIVTAAFNEELASDPENFFYGMTVGKFPFMVDYIITVPTREHLWLRLLWPGCMLCGWRRVRPLHLKRLKPYCVPFLQQTNILPTLRQPVMER